MTNNDSHVPIVVPGLSGARSVETDGYHSMTLQTDGTVRVWGYNSNGQLGNGNTTNATSPVLAPYLSAIKGLSSGLVHQLALRSEGTVAAAGYNSAGMLGNGTVTDSNVPVTATGYNRGTNPKATYSYNGDGLRMAKTVAGVTNPFSWDMAEGLPTVLSDGDKTYVYGPGALPVEQVDSTGNVSYFHHDQLGSTRLLTDVNGAVAATMTYDPYGNPTGITGSITTPLRYAGQYTDNETGFQYLRARYYDPATGQFLTRDPLEALTRSAYGYVGGSPLNGTDPMGLYWGEGVVDSVGNVANAALPVIHAIASVTSQVASTCALFTIPGSPVSDVCAVVALGAAGVTAISGTILYAEGKESKEAAYLDATGALLTGMGTVPQ